MLHRRNHSRQCIRAGIEHGIRHARINLVLKVLPLAVSGWFRIQPKRAERVTDACFQNAMINLGHIAGRRSLIVKGVGCHVLCTKCSFMHGHQVRADPFSDVFLSERTVLDKHIHLHAVAEGFMGNQAGYFRGCDDLVLARFYPPGRQKLIRAPQRLLHQRFRVCKKLRPALIGYTLVGHDIAPVLRPAGHRNNRHFTIHVALFQTFVFCQKQLGNMCRLGADNAFDQMVSGGERLLIRLCKACNDILDIGIFRQLFRVKHRGYLLRFVLRDGCFVNIRPGHRKKLLLFIQSRTDFFKGFIDMVRIKTVKRILAVLSVFCCADHHAALGCQCRGRNLPAGSGNCNIQARRIRCQQAGVIIFF